MKIRSELVALLLAPIIAGILGYGLAAAASPLGTDPWGSQILPSGFVDIFGGPGGRADAAPTAIVTVPATDPSAVSGTPTTVSGTTTGTVTGVTWATACVVGPTACSTGAGSFSCSVTQSQACASSQTVTVVATGPGGTGNDTTVVDFPTFDLVAGSTTPNDLPDTLTVNSIAMTLVLACDAQGVSGTNWSCRGPSGAVTLAEAGTGSSPTNVTATPFHPFDSAERGARCTGATAKRYEGSASLGIGTDDFVVEYIGTSGNSSNNTILGDKNDSALTGPGIKLRTGSTTASLLLADGTTLATISGPASSLPNTSAGPPTVGHFMVFVDRSENSTNGGLAYGNGAQGGGVNPSAVSGSISGAGNFSVCEEPDGGEEVTGATVYALRVWKCTACMAGGATDATQSLAIARERTTLAFGVRPTLAVGSITPTSVARASTAYTDFIDGTTRSIFNFGTNAPRTARRSSAGTNSAGYLAEPQTTNLALQSETLGTTWTAIDVGDNVLANAYAGADLATTGDNIDGDNTGASEHGLRQAITLTAATYTLSAWFKPGPKTWGALRVNTIANTVASFDGTACAACDITQGDCGAAVGTVGAGVSQARAVRYPVDTSGDGVADVELCRISITYTGTVAAHDHDLLCAAGDATFSYTDSDALADCGFWGVEVEAYPTMTSYQATTTTSVTRSADVLSFDGVNNASTSGTVAVSMLCPNFNVSTTSKLGLRVDANNFQDLNIDATNDRPGGESTVGGVAQYAIVGSSGDVADGALHETRLTYSVNDVELFYDGVSVGTDVSATMLSTLTGSTLGIGHLNSLLQSGCAHVRTRAWAVKSLRSVAP